MSLHSKVRYAEQLRGQLSSLRAARESALQQGHDDIIEQKVDDEILQLEAQVRAEQDALVDATGAGSVEDALKAMNVAADAPTPPGSDESVEMPAPGDGSDALADDNETDKSQSAELNVLPGFDIPLADTTGTKEK